MIGITCVCFQVVYVMPSSSARCAQLPRAVDKLPFFSALKKLRDHLRGDIQLADDSEVTFPDLELKVFKQEKIEPVEGEEASSQPPVSKKKKKSAASKKSAPVDDMAVGQAAMWSAVKQENGFNPGDYGQMPAANNLVSTASSAGQPHAKSLYTNVLDMNYSQANCMVTQASGAGGAVTSTNSTAAGNGAAFYQNSELHTMQPMQQFFSPGSFLQQLQAPLHPDQSQGMQFNNGQNWQQFGAVPFYQNLAVNQPQQYGHPTTGFPGYQGQQNMIQPSAAHQQPAQMALLSVKTEPSTQGYENGKRQEGQQQQLQCSPHGQPPPLQHMQHQQQHQSLQHSQQGYFPQMHQPQKQQAEMSLPRAGVKSEPRESGYECALGAMSVFAETSQSQSSQSRGQVPSQSSLSHPQHQQQKQHSPTHTNQNQQCVLENQKEPPRLMHIQQSLEQPSSQQSFVPPMQQQQPAGVTVKTEPKDQDYECALSCSKASPVQQQHSAQGSGQHLQQQQQQQQPRQNCQQQLSPTHLPYAVKSEPQDQGYECALNKNSS